MAATLRRSGPLPWWRVKIRADAVARDSGNFCDGQNVVRRDFLPKRYRLSRDPAGVCNLRAQRLVTNMLHDAVALSFHRLTFLLLRQESDTFGGRQVQNFFQIRERRMDD
jgi:hypothetical protein